MPIALGYLLLRWILLAKCKPMDGCAAMEGGGVQGMDGVGMYADVFSQVE